ncbi:MAG: GGDEF domain-containing protein [Methylophagaceae bacterium]
MTKHLIRFNNMLDNLFSRTLRPEFQENLADTRREYSLLSKYMLFGVPIIFGINLSIREVSPHDWVLYINLGYAFALSLYIHFKPTSIPLWIMVLHLPLFILMLIVTELILYEKYLAHPNFMVPLIFIISFYFHSLRFSIVLMVIAFGLLAYIFYIRDIEDALILWNLYFGSTVLTGFSIYKIISRILKTSQTDALTGLKNRGYAEKMLNAQINLSNRLSSSLSLIYIDVDNFKNINDRYGHHRGDEVLRSVANAIRSTSRGSDIISRWGGDEFVVVLPFTNLLDAQKFIERLIGSINTVGVSCGIAELQENENKDQLLTRADQSMYEVKNNKLI